ncbi:MAG: DUF5946 family protein [Terracidiphilus sp.]
MDSMRAAYDEVYVYAMGRPGFILQHVVDAFAVQSATPDSKTIGVVFGLIGLYLRVEKQLSGHKIQEIHRQLASRKREWPSIHFPENRGEVTVLEVLQATAGSERDIAIDRWCRCVWTAFACNQPAVISLLYECQIS